jgi:hypothetical protein
MENIRHAEIWENSPENASVARAFTLVSARRGASGWAPAAGAPP